MSWKLYPYHPYTTIPAAASQTIPTICRAPQHSVHQARFLVARKQGFDCRGCPRDICTTFYWTQCIGNVRDSIVTDIRQMRGAATGKDGFRSDVTARHWLGCHATVSRKYNNSKTVNKMYLETAAGYDTSRSHDWKNASFICPLRIDLGRGYTLLRKPGAWPPPWRRPPRPRWCPCTCPRRTPAAAPRARTPPSRTCPPPGQNKAVINVTV